MTKRKKKRPGVPRSMLSSGLTLLNLACSNTGKGTFRAGKFFLVVGDSASGKTFLLLTTLAEAAKASAFKNYRLIYDDVEGGALMAVRDFFGEELEKRLEAPVVKDGMPFHSTTIEDFFYAVDDAIKAKKPFIYILDSMDALSSEDEKTKFEKTKSNYRKGKISPGSFTDGKAKKNSAGIRQLLTPIELMGSIVIVVFQTREKINSIFPQKGRSGGHAPTFYACHEIWLSRKEDIKKTVKGKTRKLGIVSRIRIKKNRMTGGEPEVLVPFYRKFGFDDTGSCVDYLVTEGHWETSGDRGEGKIKAKEFKVEKPRELLIQYIEKKKLETQLQEIVRNVWMQIEEECTPKRRRKYF